MSIVNLLFRMKEKTEVRYAFICVKKKKGKKEIRSQLLTNIIQLILCMQQY